MKEYNLFQKNVSINKPLSKLGKQVLEKLLLSTVHLEIN